jgi:hypothetical protein
MSIASFKTFGTGKPTSPQFSIIEISSFTIKA